MESSAATARRSRRRGEIPPVLAEIAAAIGHEPAMKLVQAFGGTRVYIPRLPRPGQTMVEVIGLEATEKMFDLFGSGYLAIPTANYFSLRTNIMRLLSEGRSTKEIVQKLGIHERTVYRYRAVARRGLRAP